MPIAVIIIIFVYSLKSAYIYWFKTKENMEYNHKR